MVSQNPQWNLFYEILSREARGKDSVSNQNEFWLTSREKEKLEQRELQLKILGSEKSLTQCPRQGGGHRAQKRT